MVTENIALPLNRPRSWRSKLLTRQSQLVLDALVLASAFTFAYLLRFDFKIPDNEVQRMLQQLPFVLIFECGLIWATGIYAFVWRYVGMAEIKAFLAAALISGVLMILLRTWLPDELQVARVPLSITVTDCFFAFG